MSKLLKCALWFAKQGHLVFPLRPMEKRPATRNGFHDATLDPDQINRWWAKVDYNIGLPTGHRFDVLDIDLPEDAWSIVEHQDIPQDSPLAMVRTPRGGCHLYLPVSGRGNRAGMLPGIDYRGQGGYVVAPPSTVAHGEWRYIELGGLRA